jgi:hypothetical protein
MSGALKKEIVHPDSYRGCQRYVAELVWFAEAYERIFKDRARWGAIEGSKAFAFIWTVKEANALGKNPQRAMTGDPVLAAELFLRLRRWRRAFLEWYVFLMKKECPAMFDETATQRAREAAELGLRLGDKTERRTDRLIEFIKRTNELSEHEHRVFLKTALNNKPADWRHPELDTWLMLMWPVVERFKWTYRDVLEAALQKFPEHRGYPLGMLDRDHPEIGQHCRDVLGLRTAGKARRQHRHGEAPLLGLALEIETQVDVLCRFGFVDR